VNENKQIITRTCRDTVGKNQKKKAHTVEETRKRKTGPLLSVTDPD
jgi:hypothetical protein